jgi:transcriptional regulator with XRE-family HTH domain
MQRARKQAELSQKELGARVGTSQNIVSLIESGEVTSSSYILPICKVLKIPPPMHFENEDDALWSQIGHRLRTKNMKQFRRALALVEAMIDDEDDEQKPANDQTSKPATRK